MIWIFSCIKRESRMTSTFAPVSSMFSTEIPHKDWIVSEATVSLLCRSFVPITQPRQKCPFTVIHKKCSWKEKEKFHSRISWLWSMRSLGGIFWKVNCDFYNFTTILIKIIWKIKNYFSRNYFSQFFAQFDEKYHKKYLNGLLHKFQKREASLRLMLKKSSDAQY